MWWTALAWRASDVKDGSVVKQPNKKSPTMKWPGPWVGSELVLLWICGKARLRQILTDMYYM